MEGELTSEEKLNVCAWAVSISHFPPDAALAGGDSFCFEDLAGEREGDLDEARTFFGGILDWSTRCWLTSSRVETLYRVYLVYRCTRAYYA